MMRSGFSRFFLVAFLVGSLLPIYWMLNMSLKTNEEITGVMTLWPSNLTFDNYKTIFTDESWYSGYINSMIYVAMNMVMAVLLAIQLGVLKEYQVQRLTSFIDAGSDVVSVASNFRGPASPERFSENRLRRDGVRTVGEHQVPNRLTIGATRSARGVPEDRVQVLRRNGIVRVATNRTRGRQSLQQMYRRRIGCHGCSGQRPVKFAGRFSMNEATPSLKSFVRNNGNS